MDTGAGNEGTIKKEKKGSCNARFWFGRGVIGLGLLAVVVPGVPGLPIVLLGALCLSHEDPLRRRMFEFTRKLIRRIRGVK